MLRRSTVLWIEVIAPLVAPKDPAAYIERGTPEFRRANLALFSAGFSTFALLHCVQPLPNRYVVINSGHAL